MAHVGIAYTTPSPRAISMDPPALPHPMSAAEGEPSPARSFPYSQEIGFVVEVVQQFLPFKAKDTQGGVVGREGMRKESFQ